MLRGNIMTKNWPSGRKRGWSFGLGGSPSFSRNQSGGAMQSEDTPSPRIDGVELAGALKTRERGAIILPEIDISGSGTSVSIGRSQFDPDIVRASLLLFDRLDSPLNTLFGNGVEIPDGLEHWGGFQNSRVGLSGYLTSKVFQTTLVAAFRALNAREEGRWSVARAAQSVAIPASEFDQQTAFKIRLENALPIPDRSVSYDEVLNYRERRRDELLAMRHHLDDLILEINTKGFGGLAEEVAFEKYLKAIDDHAKSAKEENFLKRLTSVEIKFNWDRLVSDIPKSLALGAIMPKMATLWALGSAISIESTLGLRKASQKPNPFEYIFRAGAEM